MKNSKLLNSLIFQLLLTIIFSIRLIAAEPIDIWKGNSEIKIESAETNQINLDDEKNSLFEETQIVKTNIFQENSEDLDFNKVYGLFDPEENDLSLEIWIESDGKVLLEQLKRIEKIDLSKDSEELLIKILFTNSYLPIKNINSSDFLNYKLEWLIKKDKINIIEDFLNKNPDFSPEQIKSILMTTSDVIADEYGEKFNFDTGGAGRLNVTSAYKSEIILLPPSLTFDLSSQSNSQEKSIQIQSISQKTPNLQIEFPKSKYVKFELFKYFL